VAVLDATALVAAWAAATTTDHEWDVALRLMPAVTAAAPGWTAVDGTMPAWDRALLTTLRAVAPGAPLAAVATCPRCGAQLDVTLSPPAGPGPEVDTPEPTVITVAVAADGRDEHGAVTVTARVPTLADLDAALGSADGRPVAAVGTLVDRVVVDVAGGDGITVGVAARATVLARDDVLVALDSAIAEAEPPGLEAVRVQCADCDHEWTDHLELESFVWAAVERAATRLLDDVAVLGAAFGWGHEEVLAMPTAVRRHYLTRAGWEPA
jgi:hypothetical protein